MQYLQILIVKIMLYNTMSYDNKKLGVVFLKDFLKVFNNAESVSSCCFKLCGQKCRHMFI